MSNTLKISGAISVGKLAADPSNPDKGLIYYNTTSDQLRHYNGSSFVEITSQDELDSILGTLDATPDNYTPSEATFSGHLQGIDDSLATAGGSEFGDDVFRVTGSADSSKKVAIEVDGLTTSTTKTITMPDADVDLGDIATNNAKVSADGVVTTHSDVSDAGSGAIITTAERSKLSGIEALADVTDSANVASAGAVMESDSSTASMSFVIDEDAMGSDSDTKIPTQQSVKAYVDNEISSAVATGMDFKGDYNAATNTPDLDSSPIATAIGDTYVVTVAGTFFSTDVEIGDKLMAKQATATAESHWSIVQANLTPASIKTQYESNSDTNEFSDAEQTKLSGIESNATADQTGAEIKSAYEGEANTNAFTDAEQTKLSGIESNATADQTGAEIKSAYEGEANTNAFTDAEKTLLGNQSGTNSGDEVAASTTVSGIVELATLAEVDAGSDTTRAVTAASLATIQSDVDTNTAKVGYTAAQAKSDVVNDAISDGNTDTAPSENAVFDALALKMADLSDDSSPSLGGDLVLGNNTVIHDSNGMQRGTSSSDFLEEEYIHSIALLGSQTATVISDLTFAHASFEGCEIAYKVKESTSNDIRIGTMRIVTNGTSVVLNDMGTETADTGIVFSAAINGANVEIKYDSGSNGATIRCDVKRIKA